jgi:manganese/zinc/iron transport system substrate-binding protein
MTLMHQTIAAAGLLLAALVLSGCGGEAGGETASGKPVVVATTGMIADLARQVGGEHIEVVQLMGEGTDPHQYVPTRRDAVALQRADLVLYNGLLLEGRMGDLLGRANQRGTPTIAVADALQAAEDYRVMQGPDKVDPHVWMDVAGWSRLVPVVRDALTELAPDRAQAFEYNATAYLQQLQQLDDYARQVIGSIPENQRILVTAHDAFGYLGRAYGIEVRGIQGISTESEAGVQDIERLVQLLVDRQIPAVFVESSVAQDNIRALLEGAAAQDQQVAIGGELYSDAMGPGGTYGGTYVGMIDHNVTTIARSLGGEAPAGGMQGRLD